MNTEKIDVIYQGNCGVFLQKTSLFPDRSVDLILTSPPYADKRFNYYNGVKTKDYVEWFLYISEQLYRILKPKGSFILNIKEHAKNGERQTYVIELILKLKQQGWLWTEEYCWYKKNSYPGKWPNRFRDSWERCLHFTKRRDFSMYQDAVKIPIGDWSKTRFKSMSEKDFTRYISQNNRQFGRNVSNWLSKRKVYPHNVLSFEKEHYWEPTTVINLPTECSNRHHSATFPIELPTWFIRLFTKKGGLVFDPFIGVGTTALAATVLSRHYIGIEESAAFVELARQNINELNTI